MMQRHRPPTVPAAAREEVTESAEA